MHWDFGGQVGYEPKWHLFLIAGLSLLFAVLFPLLPKIDPRRRNYDKFSASYLFFQLIMMLFILVMVSVVLIESLRPGTLHVGKVVCLLVSLLMAVLGNMMPKFRQNYFCGIKTPWTYADADVWARTHRLGGRLFFAAGLIGMFATLLPSDFWMFLCFLIPLCCAALIPTVMSYIWYRRRHPE